MKHNNLQNQPKKIFFVWNYLEWGGAQIYFLAIIKEIKKYCQVSVVMPDGSNPQLLKFLDDLEVSCEFVNAHTDNRPAPSLKRKLERHFKKLRSEYAFCRHLGKYDLNDAVVHAEFAPWQSFGALLWLLLRRAKVFTTVHNSVFPNHAWRLWGWRLKFGILCRFKNFRIFTANEDAKKCLGNYVPGNFYDSITVTYASINPQEINEALAVKLNREELCRKFGIPSDKFLVFCVGQFIDRKGRWVFLEAAQKLAQKYSDIVFVWVSNSKPADEDLRKAESYDLGERFVLITSEEVGQERSDLFHLVRLADVFALPSFVEGLPISLLEAMALGKPCISTRINGIPEAISHLETGWLIEPGKTEELAEAIETLKTDNHLREKLAVQGRGFVLQNFDERLTARTAWESYAQV